MIVEIGSMISLNLGTKLYDILKEDDKVVYVFIETGRSEDLFEDKQFGEFGEASILTVLVEKDDQEEVFAKIYDILKEDDKVVYVFIETGRSEDLFEDKQFGEFGEASILTVLVEKDNQEEVFAKIYEAAGLDKKDSGLLFTGQHIETYS